jgi:hypothetical protein
LITLKNYLTYNYYFNCLKYSKMKKILKSDSGLQKGKSKL